MSDQAPPSPTPEQQAAIDARGGDVFLEAGAGTGKTRTLVDLYCAAVCDDDVGVDRILAFTFTDRAASELRGRVRRELLRRSRLAAETDPDRAAMIARAARDTERGFVTTIHGFCRRLLATNPGAAGVDPRFRVLDQAEAARLAGIAATRAIDELADTGDPSVIELAAGFRPGRLGELLRLAHERLRSQGSIEPKLPDPGDPVRSIKKKDEAPLSPAEEHSAREAIGALQRVLDRYGELYSALKDERSGLDFEDLQLRARELLEREGPVRDAWRGRFEHVLVDEFQDTNSVQVGLIEALRGEDTKVLTVGDEFQSIYRFRNADLEVFRRRRAAAEADPGTQTLALRGNFRSRPEIVAAVDSVGGALLDGFRPLVASVEPDGEPPGDGPAVELRLTESSGGEMGGRGDGGWSAEGIELEAPESERNPVWVAEARALAARLHELAEAGVPRGDMVVLLRAFTHVDAYEEALERAGLAPYIVGGRGYWSAQQVEDVLRLLRVIANPLDDEALFGALSSPACGASADALWLLREAAGRRKFVWPVLERAFVEGEPLDAPIDDEDRARLITFCATLGELRAEAPTLPLDALIDRTISAYDYDLALLTLPEGRGRMANVRKLMRLAAEFETHEGRDLRGFISYAEERTARDEREGQAALQAEEHDGVRVMTVHAAKGLEFPVVAVADLGRRLSAGGRAGDLVIGRFEDGSGDEAAGADVPFGMRLAMPAQKSLRLWQLVELEDANREADAEEACRLTYVAATRAQKRLILSGVYDPEKHVEPGDPVPGDTALRRFLPALHELGWGGGEGLVAIPPAEGVQPAGTPEIAVTINRPSPERAAELCRRLPALEPPAAETPEAEVLRPPLLEIERVPALAGRLSYSALAAYERCGYRFYVERVLGLTGDPLGPADDEQGAEGEPAGEADVTGAEDELVDPPGDHSGMRPLERRLAIGNAVHAGLEWSARNGWREPDEERLLAALTAEGLGSDMEALARVEELVRGWLGSELRRELDGARVYPELPFALEIGGAIVRGKMDLLAELPGGELVVVDYKTDDLAGRSPAELAERYRIQRAVYALAAEVTRADRDAEHPPLRSAYCFLEAADDVVAQTHDAADLTEGRRELEAIVGRIEGGEFVRTEKPEGAICYGCPAAARLCGAPAWRPPKTATAPRQEQLFA